MKWIKRGIILFSIFIERKAISTNLYIWSLLFNKIIIYHHHLKVFTHNSHISQNNKEKYDNAFWMIHSDLLLINIFFVLFFITDEKGMRVLIRFSHLKKKNEKSCEFNTEQRELSIAAQCPKYIKWLPASVNDEKKFILKKKKLLCNNTKMCNFVMIWSKLIIWLMETSWS